MTNHNFLKNHWTRSKLQTHYVEITTSHIKCNDSSIMSTHTRAHTPHWMHLFWCQRHAHRRDALSILSNDLRSFWPGHFHFELYYCLVWNVWPATLMRYRGKRVLNPLSLQQQFLRRIVKKHDTLGHTECHLDQVIKVLILRFLYTFLKGSSCR